MALSLPLPLHPPLSISLSLSSPWSVHPPTPTPTTLRSARHTCVCGTSRDSPEQIQVETVCGGSLRCPRSQPSGDPLDGKQYGERAREMKGGRVCVCRVWRVEGVSSRRDRCCTTACYIPDPHQRPPPPTPKTTTTHRAWRHSVARVSYDHVAIASDPAQRKWIRLGMRQAPHGRERGREGERECVTGGERERRRRRVDTLGRFSRAGRGSPNQ